MRFVHNIIKIHYIKEGYLPNYPYHLISDEEMCQAFLPFDISSEGEWNLCPKDSKLSYFYDNYPLLKDSLSEAYEELLKALLGHIKFLLEDKTETYIMPNWVYSYMLGIPLSVNSDKLDIHDMLVSMGIDNIDDEFTSEASQLCYNYSQRWLRKMSQDRRLEGPNNADKSEYILRPLTMFGESHVLKYLRLLDVDMSK